jgi:cytochrome c peroxidase
VPAMRRILLACGVAGVIVFTLAAALVRPSGPAEAGGPFAWKLPLGLPPPRVPADNPMTTDKVALGRLLFYDTRISGNGTYACASCHEQAHAFTDGRARALGSTGGLHPRSTMSLTNVAYNASFGWADPTLRSLEAQMSVPMFNEHPIELGIGGHEAEIVGRIARTPEYTRRFATAFPGDRTPVSLANIVKAIASFERTLVSGGSPLDRYLYKDDRGALSTEAVRGMRLFFSDRLACGTCHETFNLSGPVDYQGATGAVKLLFHNNGLYDVDGRGAYPAMDRGLIDKTQNAPDMGHFRAPTLRNIALTAPYMHDGSIPSLEAVLQHYARGGHGSVYRSDRVKGFPLSPSEARDLIAFLEALTDREFVTNPAFSRPVVP